MNYKRILVIILLIFIPYFAFSDDRSKLKDFLLDFKYEYAELCLKKYDLRNEAAQIMFKYFYYTFNGNDVYCEMPDFDNPYLEFTLPTKLNSEKLLNNIDKSIHDWVGTEWKYNGSYYYKLFSYNGLYDLLISYYPDDIMLSFEFSFAGYISQ